MLGAFKACGCEKDVGRHIVYNPSVASGYDP